MYCFGLLNRFHTVWRVTGVEGNMYWYYVLYWFTVKPFLYTSCIALTICCIEVKCIGIKYCIGPLKRFLTVWRVTGIEGKMYWYYVLSWFTVKPFLYNPCIPYLNSVVSRLKCIGIMHCIGLLNRFHTVWRVTSIEGNMYWYYVLYWFTVKPFLYTSCIALTICCIKVKCIGILYCIGPLNMFHTVWRVTGIEVSMYWYYVLYWSSKYVSYSLKGHWYLR